MFNTFTVFTGLRNFSQSKSSRLVSFISVLAISGLILGVALLVTVLSVMNGFDHEMETRILGQVPHIRLYQSDQPLDDWQQLQADLQSRPQITSVEPYVRRDGLLSGSGNVVPVTLEGLSFDEQRAAALLGPLLTGSPKPQIDQGIFVSGGVAKQLDLGTGDRVTFMMPVESAVQSSAPGFKAVGLTIAGVFDTHTSLDQFLIVGEISVVAELAGLAGQVEGLQLSVANVLGARQTGYQLLRDLPAGYSFNDWLQSYGHLYQAIKMSRNLVSLLVLLIIGLAVFNVISMLVMSVVDKKSAIAIYKTLGATKYEIMAIFIVQGILIGLVGTLVGEVVGLLLTFNLDTVVAAIEMVLGRTLLNTQVYPIDFLPTLVQWKDLALIAAISMLLNLTATLYPAWKASTTRPAEVLSQD